jgi:ABC-type ATPase involved in cell division
MVATHNPQVMAQTNRRVLMLDQGKLIEDQRTGA